LFEGKSAVPAAVRDRDGTSPSRIRRQKSVRPSADCADAADAADRGFGVGGDDRMRGTG